MTQALFHSGDITYSLAARATLQQAGESGLLLLYRHLSGDWGDITARQRQANRAALAGDILRDTVVSSYRLPGGEVAVLTRYLSEPSLRWTDICLAEEVDTVTPEEAEDDPPDEDVFDEELFETEMLEFNEDDPDFPLEEAEVLEFLEMEVV
jgi:hypothetical protein